MVATVPMGFLPSAMRDARVATDARGLMPLDEARTVVAQLTRFEKAASASSNVLGADLAWAALLSLRDVDEFLEAALRIEWSFHVRGHGNVAAIERYGDGILPWIRSAIDEHGTLRNVPWCLYPCLLAIGTAEAMDVAFLVRRTNADLERSEPAETPADDALDLGAAPAWLAHRAAERLPIVAERASHDPRCRALLARAVASLGVASIAALRHRYGDDAKVEAALAALRIPVPRTPPEIEAQLAGLPRSDVPEGPPWSVIELDQDDMFPYWEVLSGYETPYAVRVHAFASSDGDALVVQRISRDERGNEPCARYVAVYGPGKRTFDPRRCMAALVSPDDVAGLHLAGGGVVVDGVSEVAELWADADERGAAIPGVFRCRAVRNPMPHESILVRIAGTDDDLLVPPREPASWVEVAEIAAREDAAEIARTGADLPPLTADAMLRGIDPAEQVLLRLVTEHRELLFLGEAELREIGSLPAGAELLFVIEDPELPEIYAQRPPSIVAPWPLLAEALRRRVRLDPARVPRADVLKKRMRWTRGRGGATDAWGAETSPTMDVRPRSIGASAHADELLARGWPHGVRLLHQHPHNDAAPAVFDWLIAQPQLPYRSHWPREIATRFVRHLGGDPTARENGAWIFEREARRILGNVIDRTTSELDPLRGEHLTLVLESMVGGPALCAIARDVLESFPPGARAAPRPDASHVLAALGWVVRRIRSSEGADAVAQLRALAGTLDRATDLGRGLDLALEGDAGVRRSARRPEELALARDATLVREMLGDAPLPLDLQLAQLLGEEAIDRWEQAEMSPADAAWFAGELVLLASPRAHALAAKLTE